MRAPTLGFGRAPRAEDPRELKILAVHQPKLSHESQISAEVCTPNQFSKVTTLTGTTAGVGSAGAAVSPSLASHGPLVNILARLTGRGPYGYHGPV